MIGKPKFETGDLVEITDVHVSYRVESIERRKGQWWYWGPHGDYPERDLKRTTINTHDYQADFGMA